jgi:tetratricopeptide (TPR) repeat protein
LEAAAQDSGNAHIWFHLGQAHSHLDEVALAKNCFEKSLQIKPNNSEALYALGQVYKSLQQKDKAKEVLVKFKTISDFEKSKASLLKRIGTNPKNLELKKELAALYESVEDYKSAAEVWQQAAYFGDQNAQLELERLKSKLNP